MTRETKAVIALAVAIAPFALFAFGDPYGRHLFGGIYAGIAATVLVHKSTKWFSSLVVGLTAQSAAHAIGFILFALGIGAVIGIAGLVIIKLVSAFISLHNKEQQRQEQRDQAQIEIPIAQVSHVTVSQPTPEPEPEFQLANIPKVYFPYPGTVLIMPMNGQVEFSTNCINWGPPPHNATELQMGFWRVKM